MRDLYTPYTYHIKLFFFSILYFYFNSISIVQISILYVCIYSAGTGMGNAVNNGKLTYINVKLRKIT